VVRPPVGDVSIDRTGRVAGRGAYVCRAAECIDNAIRKGALNRALNTSVPAELREALTAELTDQMTTTRGGARGQE
jgi:predicted RNA-binding protein YlxR (DUF448 family)